jgi:hypothetical protein
MSRPARPHHDQLAKNPSLLFLDMGVPGESIAATLARAVHAKLWSQYQEFLRDYFSALALKR